jgi:hypothetical protein
MGWIHAEPLGFFCPGFADELAECEIFEDFESGGEVVSGEEFVWVLS